VKGNIHWLSTRHARVAEVRLYDRLFAAPQPGSAAAAEAQASLASDAAFDEDVSFDEPTVRNYLDDLNPHSRKVVTAYVETALAEAVSGERCQFERHGYFIADALDHAPGKPVFNRAVTLRDSWAKAVPVRQR
jgi:glutaminyl-tRNA synthetase